MFLNDVELVNNYAPENTHANIRYIPSIYSADYSKKGLPYRRISFISQIPSMKFYLSRRRWPTRTQGKRFRGRGKTSSI